MIFQEPMTSFSPVHTIGNQIMEPILVHEKVSEREARHRAIEMLRKVGMPRAERHVDEYPHQISGGMRQRAMIAMALTCNPELLIADEPTTALDVTTQAQILELMLQLKAEFGMSILMITHDLAVVAEMADDVAVMYLGKVVEQSDVASLFYDAKHPYTQALLRSIPQLGQELARLEVIRGMIPDPYNRPKGCTFHPRCRYAMRGVCNVIDPPAISFGPDHDARCLLYGGAESIPESAALIETRLARMRANLGQANGASQAAGGAAASPAMVAPVAAGEPGSAGPIGETTHAG
jgi:peptide/nickel transport system ATP-binding protein